MIVQMSAQRSRGGAAMSSKGQGTRAADAADRSSAQQGVSAQPFFVCALLCQSSRDKGETAGEKRPSLHVLGSV